MLEREIGARRHATPEQELGLDKFIKRIGQRRLRQVRDRSEQIVRERAAERGGDLCEPFSGVESVEARQQRGLQARRYRQWPQRGVEHIGVVRLAQQIAFYQSLGQLLDKQWYTIGVLDDAVEDHR